MQRARFGSNATSSHMTHDIAMIEPSSSSGPPASAILYEYGSQQPVQLGSTGPQHGSSQDQDDVSFQLAAAKSTDQNSSSVSHQPAPMMPTRSSDNDVEGKETLSSSSSEQVEKPSSVQPKQMTRPAQSTNQRGKQAGGSAASIVTDMSEKELKATTQYNTIHNQVYLCAIDRLIVRKPGPRPPSPSSKIPTTADRDKAERKAGRGERAKRRSRSSDGDSDRDESDGGENLVMERVSHARGPGEDEDYATPVRPGKKLKMAHEQSERPKKSVTWDKGLVVVRHREGEGVSRPRLRDSSVEDAALSKGCLRDEGKVRVSFLLHPTVIGKLMGAGSGRARPVGECCRVGKTSGEAQTDENSRRCCLLRWGGTCTSPRNDCDVGWKREKEVGFDSSFDMVSRNWR